MANLNTGVASRDTGTDTIKSAWKKADIRNREALPEGMDGVWIPWRAIDIDKSILPRQTLDKIAIEEYSEILDALPAIEVQDKTLKLIAGSHRIEATVLKGQELIRAKILDVPDSELRDLAFKSNGKHGVPYKRADRRNYAVAKIKQYPDWTNRRLMFETGLSERTIATLRSSLVDKADDPKEAERLAPRTRTTATGKVQKVAAKPDKPAKASKKDKVTASSNGVDLEASIPKSTTKAPADFVVLARLAELLDYPASLLVKSTPRNQLATLSESIDTLREKTLDWFQEARSAIDMAVAGIAPEPEPIAQAIEPTPEPEPLPEPSPENEPSTVEPPTGPDELEVSDEELAELLDEPIREPIETVA